jgi:uncharacterized delta-60 repeat protein
VSSTRKLGLLAAVAAVLLLPASASAKRSNELDQSFGNHGRAVAALDFGGRRFWYAVHVYSALTPAGDVVLAGSNSNGIGAQIVRYLPSGLLDPNFGQGGLLRIDSVEGGEFGMADLTVDSLGRIVLTGGAGPSWRAVVMRLKPDGAPDPTFGGGDGVVFPEFGIPQFRLTPVEIEPPAMSRVYLTAIAVDVAGRIVLTGSAARAPSYCVSINSGIVGRLTADGSIDTSFGNGGVVVYEPDVIDSVPSLALDRSGAATIWGVGDSCRESPTGGPQIARLSPDGRPDSAFGADGHVALAQVPTHLALDRFGRTLFLESNGSVHRLLLNGNSDQGFGHNGVVHLNLRGKWSRFHDLAVAPNGSVLVTGVQTQYHGTANPWRRLVLASLTAKGKPRRAFGTNGVLKLRSGRGVNTVGRQVMVDAKGRALVAGTVGNLRLPGGQGLVLYRFDLRGQ